MHSMARGAPNLRDLAIHGAVMHLEIFVTVLRTAIKLIHYIRAEPPWSISGKTGTSRARLLQGLRGIRLTKAGVNLSLAVGH